MTETKKPKVDPNWQAIEHEYRLGIDSLRQIGARHGVSHAAIDKRAKKNGWVRDLAERTRLVTQEKLAGDALPADHPAAVDGERLTVDAVDSGVDNAGAASTSKIVAKALQVKQQAEDALVDLQSDTQVAIIRSHKRSLSVQARLRDKLFQQVELMIDNADVLREYVESIDESGPNENGTWVVDRKAQMMQAILESPEVAKTLKVLSEVDERVRKGEREAYGIDKTKDEKTNIEELLDRVRGDMKASR